MFLLEYNIKCQRILFLLNVWNFIFSCSEDQHVSFSVTEVSLSEISTHPNECVFVPSKAGLDKGGQKKAIEFSTYLIKSIFVIRLSLGKTQFIMISSLLQYF